MSKFSYIRPAPGSDPVKHAIPHMHTLLNILWPKLRLPAISPMHLSNNSLINCDYQVLEWDINKPMHMELITASD